MREVGALEAVVSAGHGQQARGRVQAELLEDVLGLWARDGRGRSKLNGRLPGGTERVVMSESKKILHLKNILNVLW